MKTHSCLLIFGLLIFVSCNSKKKETSSADSITKSISETEVFQEPASELANVNEAPNKSDTLVYVDILDKFYDSENYFLSLYYRNDYSESVSNELENVDVELLRESEDGERHIRLSNELVNKHLLAGNLDRLVVFNKQQEITDTIYRKDFELYESMIESSYVATYSGPSGFEGCVAMSINGIKNLGNAKSPEFASDTNYIKRTLKQNKYRATFIHNGAYTVHLNDTISFISFGVYPECRECTYLFKNGVPSDSIINDYSIQKLTPVPLANEKELVYVANVSVPETDHCWTMLMAIDLEKIKFKIYPSGRYIKPFEIKKETDIISEQKIVPDTFYHADHRIICDSSLFVGLEKNLILTTDSIPLRVKDTVDSIVDAFFKEECELDQMFCDSTYLKIQRAYRIKDSDKKILLFGYTFVGSGTEEESASMFIMAGYNDDQILWHEINEDLMGEIKMELYGAKIYNYQLKIWGTMYSYFGHSGYGKFLMSGFKDHFSYRFECNEK